MQQLTPPPCAHEMTIGNSRTFVVWRDDLPQESDLTCQLPAAVIEESKTMKAPVRRQEYLGARWLIRKLLNSEYAVVRGAAGVPSWPPGIAGSISHKSGHVCVAIAQAEKTFGIGVDLESITKFNPGIAHKICNDSEQERLGQAGEQGDVKLQALYAMAFAFKEAIYKTYYPTGKVQFWFEDAEIIGADISLGKVHAVIKKEVSPHAKSGHMVTGHFCWLERNGEQYVLVVVEEAAK